MPNSNDFQVLISYKQLLEMLQAVDEVPKLRRELQRNNAELTALKGLYSDVLSRLGEVIKLL